MTYEAQFLEDERRLRDLKIRANTLLEEYHDIQMYQKNLIQEMRIKRYKFELEQIMQREKLEFLKFEKKMDWHVSMLSSVFTVELLSKIDQYVDKKLEWQKHKSNYKFHQEYDTLKILFAVQKRFHEVESKNLQVRQELEQTHVGELNILHMDKLHEIDHFLIHQDILKLKKQQNHEMTRLGDYQEQNDIVTIERMKKEEELILTVAKIHKKDHLPPSIDKCIVMADNGYRFLHLEISSLPKINFRLPLDNQEIALEKIYHRFYFIQLQLVKLYPKITRIHNVMKEFLQSKDIQEYMMVERVLHW